MVEIVVIKLYILTSSRGGIIGETDEDKEANIEYLVCSLMTSSCALAKDKGVMLARFPKSESISEKNGQIDSSFSATV